MKKVLLSIIAALFVVSAASSQSERLQSARTAVIPINTAISAAVTIPKQSALGIVTPAVWTAAAITFDVSADGVTYAALFNQAGTEITIPSASVPTGAARAFVLDSNTFAGWRFLKIRSGIEATPVNQAAARTITVVTRPVY